MPPPRKTAAVAKRRHRDSDAESQRPRKKARNDDATGSDTDDPEDIASSESDEIQSVAGEPATGKDDNVKRMRIYLEQTRKAVREADLDTIVGPVEPIFTAKWTRQDEDAMLAEWDASPEKQAYASLRQNFALKSLWKVCMRMFRCTPLDLMSPLRQLRYSASPIFAQPFCNALAPLIPHPVWEGSSWLLAMALQYAVICRTDDRRPWRPEPVCAALELLDSSIRRVKSSKMPRPIHKMHQDARQRAVRQRRGPCLMSHLLHQIGECVPKMMSKRVPTTDETIYQGHQVYSVINFDLRVITEAIRVVSTAGQPMLLPVDKCYEVFKQARQSHDPPNAQQLREFYERAGRQQLRLLAKRARRNMLGPGEDREADEEAGMQLEDGEQMEDDPSLTDVDSFPPDIIGVDDDGDDDDDDDFASSSSAAPVQLRRKAPTSAPEVTSQLDAIEKRLFRKISEQVRQEVRRELLHQGIRADIDALRQERRDEMPLNDLEMEDLGDFPPPSPNPEEHSTGAEGNAKVDDPKTSPSPRNDRSRVDPTSQTAPDSLTRDIHIQSPGPEKESHDNQSVVTTKSQDLPQKYRLATIVPEDDPWDHRPVSSLHILPGSRKTYNRELSRNPLYQGTYVQRLTAIEQRKRN